MVHFLDTSDTKRIDSLFPGPAANAPEDEPTAGAPAGDAPNVVPAAATAP